MASILIVDDTLDGRLPLARLLQREGHQISCVDNGEQALKAMRNERPDLIVLDQMMPVMDGLTFLQNVQRFPRFRDVPVVMMSAISSPESMARARALGVRDYIVKSATPIDQILQTIRKNLPKETADA